MCPYCQSTRFKVVSSQSYPWGKVLQRRCKKCGEKVRGLLINFEKYARIDDVLSALEPVLKD